VENYVSLVLPNVLFAMHLVAFPVILGTQKSLEHVSAQTLSVKTVQELPAMFVIQAIT
jgi:hypothetical protein